jgi:geranylgeranyl reductase family protein
VAAAAAAARDGNLVLTARAENYLHGNPSLADTIARLRRLVRLCRGTVGPGHAGARATLIQVLTLILTSILILSVDEIWDVAVIGAGPAGAMAAHAAASQGKRVVILERFRIPRYKTCAGGLIGASMKALPAGFTPPVVATATTFTFSLRGRPGKTKASKVPLINVVHRDEFDALLVDAAVAAGAVVYDDTMVTQLTAAVDAMCITTRNRGELRARVVVGADGSAGRSAAYVGVVLDQVDLGLEIELVPPSDQSKGWANRVLVDWGTIPGAYAWVFPKGDTLSVGVVAERGNPDQTRAYLRDFLARLELDRQEVVVSSGHLARTRVQDSPLYEGRVLVAGDAAGLLEPWTREGISFALRSGTMAGQAAARAAEAASAAEVAIAMSAYAAEISATLVPEMRAGRLFLRAFTRHPRVFYAAIILFSWTWDFVVNSITGDVSFADITRWRPVRMLLRALGGRS